MILTIDAGNTRTKWGVFDETGELVALGALNNGQIERLALEDAAWEGCHRAVVSNVAGEALGQQLRSQFAAQQLPALWAKAEAETCGVTNGYAHPRQLGTDRWMALVAAWNRYQQPCVVAMAGTALTVDALSAQGEFLGGLILPGKTLMQAGLVAGAAALNIPLGEVREFPTNTGDAVASGLAFAMAGAVARQCSALEQREGSVRCLLSGGDAPWLAAALPETVEIVDNLVLQGLFLIEREHP